MLFPVGIRERACAAPAYSACRGQDLKGGTTPKNTGTFGKDAAQHRKRPSQASLRGHDGCLPAEVIEPPGVQNTMVSGDCSARSQVLSPNSTLRLLWDGTMEEPLADPSCMAAEQQTKQRQQTTRNYRQPLITKEEQNKQQNHSCGDCLSNIQQQLDSTTHYHLNNAHTQQATAPTQ